MFTHRGSLGSRAVAVCLHHVLGACTSTPAKIVLRDLNLTMFHKRHTATGNSLVIVMLELPCSECFFVIVVTKQRIVPVPVIQDKIFSLVRKIVIFYRS
jgi:hypothetical protein